MIIILILAAIAMLMLAWKIITSILDEEYHWAAICFILLLFVIELTRLVIGG